MRYSKYIAKPAPEIAGLGLCIAICGSFPKATRSKRQCPSLWPESSSAGASPLTGLDNHSIVLRPSSQLMARILEASSDGVDFCSPSTRQSPRKKNPTNDVPTASTRKTHRCKHCQQPRQGHPKSGCPNVVPPIVPKSPNEAQSLSDALHDMQIASPTKGRVGSDHQSSVRVYHTKGKMRPLSLHPPETPSAMTTPQKMEVGQANFTAKEDAYVVRSRPLEPTMSQVERQIFLERAKKTSEAHVTVLKQSTSDIPDIVAGAKEVGLHARVIPSAENPARATTALVVVGRDKEVVNEIGDFGGRDKEAVHKALDKEMQKGNFSVLIATGSACAVAGAVATWTGLAFS